MSVPGQHRFTVDEYFHLVEIGVLHPKSPVELLDGEIHDLSPPAPFPRLHRFSIRDYYRMAQAGIVEFDARLELPDDPLHDMSPIGPLHGAVVDELGEFFAT